MLSETFADRGRHGHELLKKHLNSYFEVLMRESTSQGGDVFKFAGDAILVVWPRSTEALSKVTRRAVQCAIQIKEQLTGYKILDPDRPEGKKQEMVLNVKLGIGVGKISILHIGGYFGRMEYVATGDPLSQAFDSEGHCRFGDDTHTAFS
jgi:class 3 adenylate cyclase